MIWRAWSRVHLSRHVSKRLLPILSLNLRRAFSVASACFLLRKLSRAVSLLPPHLTCLSRVLPFQAADDVRVSIVPVGDAFRLVYLVSHHLQSCLRVHTQHVHDTHIRVHTQIHTCALHTARTSLYKSNSVHARYTCSLSLSSLSVCLSLSLLSLSLSLSLLPSLSPSISCTQRATRAPDH